jgi:hypothetical protein
MINTIEHHRWYWKKIPNLIKDALLSRKNGPVNTVIQGKLDKYSAVNVKFGNLTQPYQTYLIHLTLSNITLPCLALPCLEYSAVCIQYLTDFTTLQHCQFGLITSSIQLYNMVNVDVYNAVNADRWRRLCWNAVGFNTPKNLRLKVVGRPPSWIWWVGESKRGSDWRDCLA